MEATLAGANGHVSGTTTSSYVTVLSIPGYGGINGKTIFYIINADGATKTMYYKINGYYSAAQATAIAVKAETDITDANAITNTDADKPYAKIEVQVKTHSAACNYTIDYMTY